MSSRSSFFARYGLLILCAVFFLVPFALRGARMSLERMENNVKDWLPNDFPETLQLSWFAKHFVGQQAFVLMTWEGCSDQDPSYELYLQKLRGEMVPEPSAEDEIPELQLSLGERAERRWRQELEAARHLGDTLGLYTTGDYHENHAGLNEKWIKGKDTENEYWYYITPDGKLYRWHGRPNVLDALKRTFRRTVLRDRQVKADFVQQLGDSQQDDVVNPFYADPRRVTARVVKSVMSGPEVLAELTAPGGALYPIGGDLSEEERAREARKLAIDRLSGVLFGPGVFSRFDWTTDGLPALLTKEQIEQLPGDWRARADSYLRQLVQTRGQGDRKTLAAASPGTQDQYWNDLCSTLEIRPAGLQSCLLVTLNDAGTRDLRQVIGRGLLGKPRGNLVDLAVDSGVLAPPLPPILPFAPEPELKGPVLRMGGPPVDNVAIDEEGQITLVRLIGFAIVMGIGLSYLCFRSVKITIMIFFVGGVSAVAALSLVWWTGSSIDAILMSMPALVYVLGLSGAVHIVNYYREAVDEQGLEGAPERAVGHGFMPCTLAAFTTALGLISLYQSNIVPIKRFGLYSALGVMATLVLLFTYLPAAMTLWPVARQGGRSGPGMIEQGVGRFWDTVGQFVIRRYAIVGLTCVGLMGLFAVGLTRLQTEVQLLKMFDSQAKIIRDYHWLEHNLGKLVPMELIVRVDESLKRPELEDLADANDAENATARMQYSVLERVELVAQIQNAVERVFGPKGEDKVGKAMSAATFTPPILDPADRQRFTTNKILEQNLQRLQNENYLAFDEDKASELWRISLRLGALQNVDYGLFVNDLKRVVEPVVSAYAYRDQILQTVAAQLPDSTWNGARVCVLGAPNPEATDIIAAGKKTEKVPQTALFADTLWRLLRAKGFKRAGPKRFVQWHDPQAQPFPQGYGTSDRWAALLEQCQVVVLIDNPRNEQGQLAYDQKFLEQHAGVFVDARQHRFDPADQAYQTAEARQLPIRVAYTGVVPVVYKAQRTLLVSLIESIALAFAMIAAVMTVLMLVGSCRWINVPAGMVSMLPNVFPVVIIFGYMGFRDIRVDIGTMMCASVAMGVAVDDTIHFLTWFRASMRRGLSRPAAIRESYRRVATAMTQTTLIGGLGLSVFALSTFTPTQRFGTMMLTLLVAALVGDLVMLPALLASPLGKFFAPRVRPETQAGYPADAQEDEGGKAEEAWPPPDETTGPSSKSESGRAGTPHAARSGERRRTAHLRRDGQHDPLS